MSRSLLSSALRVTEIERLMSYHDIHAMIGEQYENNRRIFISNLYNDYEAGLVYPYIEMQGITRPCTPNGEIKCSNPY